MGLLTSSKHLTQPLICLGEDNVLLTYLIYLVLSKRKTGRQGPVFQLQTTFQWTIFFLGLRSYVVVEGGLLKGDLYTLNSYRTSWE